MKFTGEFMVPEQSGERIEADHRARYAFASKFTKGKRVLDIACGEGYAIGMLEATEYRGVDINADLVDHANATYGPYYETGDVRIYRSGQFDVVCCFETIEHVREYREAIETVKLALVPGGTLLISSPNRPVTSPGCSIRDQPLNKFHTQEFTPEELTQELEAAGLSVQGIFGQRQRLQWFFRYMNGVLRRLGLSELHPDEVTSHKVRPARMTPRYFVVVATKRSGSG